MQPNPCSLNHVDRDILPFEVAVSQPFALDFFGNGFRNFQVVLELSNHRHQRLSPFYHVENFDLTFFQIQGDACLFFKVFIYCCYYLIRMY